MKVFVDSFVDAEGSVRSAGSRLYRFEFHEMFGPTLIDRKGVVLKVQPMSARHPFWKPFYVWLADYYRKKGDVVSLAKVEEVGARLK